jgi:hypothetical protein
MARKKNSDLAEYQEWLEINLFISSSTTPVYASHIRSTLPWLKDPQDEGAVTDDFTRMQVDCSPKVLSGRRTAWKHFAAFAKTKGIDLAVPRKIRNHRGPPELSHAVRAALAYLTSNRRFKHNLVPLLRWSMVVGNTREGMDTSYLIWNPAQPSEQLAIPAEHIEALKEHAQTPGEDGPLLPAFAGSLVPYPWRAFRRELRAYRDSVSLDDVCENWEEVFKSSTGAALPVSRSAAEVGAQALAEQAKDVALAQGFTVEDSYESQGDFTPSHTTDQLRAFIEEGKAPPVLLGAALPEAVNPADPADPEEIPKDLAAEGGPTDDGSREVDPSKPKCEVCGHPEDQHRQLRRGDHTLKECAQENGYPEDTCQMCEGRCHGRHVFASME